MNSQYMTLATLFGVDLAKPFKAAKTNKIVSEKEIILNTNQRPTIFAEAAAEISA